MAAAGGNVDAGDGLFMAAQLVGGHKGVAGAGVEGDGGVAGNGEGVAVGGEGMVGDGAVEEMVDVRVHSGGLDGRLSTIEGLNWEMKVVVVMLRTGISGWMDDGWWVYYGCNITVLLYRVTASIMD